MAPLASRKPDTRDIGVIILGDFTGIEEGQLLTVPVRCLVPVGDAPSVVVDPLGTLLMTWAPIKDEGRRALELRAPGVTQRSLYRAPRPVLKAIDAMIPIGRGQRQLIIGDRQIGKLRLQSIRF